MCVDSVVDIAYVGYCVDGDDWGGWIVLVVVLVIVCIVCAVVCDVCVCGTFFMVKLVSDVCI